jgi:hypothetical protein
MHSMSGPAPGVNFFAGVGAVGLLQAAVPSTAAASTRREMRVMGVSRLKEPHFYRRP